MSMILLRVGGIFNILSLLLHVWMGKAIINNQSIAHEIRPIIFIFNIWICLVVFFFAFISFFCYRELPTTKLGKATLVLIALFYFIRAVEEIIFFKSFSPLIIAYAIIGAIYTAVLFIGDPDEEKAKMAS